MMYQFSKWPPSAIFDLWHSSFLTTAADKKPILRQHTIALFVIFKMAAAAILDFQKFEILTVGSQCASSCQISSKSVKRLQRYVNLTVFKMVAVRLVGFVKVEFFNGHRGWDPFCISVPNFVKIGKTVAEILWFLWFLRWRLPPSWILKNSKF